MYRPINFRVQGFPGRWGSLVYSKANNPNSNVLEGYQGPGPNVAGILDTVQNYLPAIIGAGVLLWLIRKR